MSTQKKKKVLPPGARYEGDPWDDEGWRKFGIFFLVWVAAFAVMLIFQIGKIENGKFVSFTPMPTATPSHFDVKAEILTAEVVGSDWDGYVTWVTMKANDITFSRKFSADDYAMFNESIGKKIILHECFDRGEDGYLNCVGGFDILDN